MVLKTIKGGNKKEGILEKHQDMPDKGKYGSIDEQCNDLELNEDDLYDDNDG